MTTEKSEKAPNAEKPNAGKPPVSMAEQMGIGAGEEVGTEAWLSTFYAFMAGQGTDSAISATIDYMLSQTKPLEMGLTKAEIKSTLRKLKKDLKEDQKQQNQNPVSKDGIPISIREQDYARHFAEAHSDRLRYNATRGSWMVWDGLRWQEDKRGRHISLAVGYSIDVSHALEAHPAIEDGEWGFSKRASFPLNILKLAPGDPSVASIEDDFDADPYRLNTPNGIFDLKTGERFENEQKHMMSHITGVAPDFEAETPAWDAFLAESFPDGKADFLLDYCAYMLSGDVSLEMFVYLWGAGGNGKGAFAKTVFDAMGSYYKAADRRAFISDGGKHAPHPTVYASLSGVRATSVSETQEGESFRMDMIKQITGNEAPISCHFMRKDPFDMVVRFKMLFISNEALDISSIKESDEAIGRRLHVVHADHKPEVADTGLKDALKAEAPGVLADLIRRAAKVLEAGRIEVPESVKAATKAYIAKQSSMTELWEAVTVPKPGCLTGIMYASIAMRIWAARNGGSTKKTRAEDVRKWLEANRPGVITIPKNRPTIEGFDLTEEGWQMVMDDRLSRTGDRGAAGLTQYDREHLAPIAERYGRKDFDV